MNKEDKILEMLNEHGELLKMLVGEVKEIRTEIKEIRAEIKEVKAVQAEHSASIKEIKTVQATHTMMLVHHEKMLGEVANAIQLSTRLLESLESRTRNLELARGY